MEERETVAIYLSESAVLVTRIRRYGQLKSCQLKSGQFKKVI
mgnify:CR=1 FL=1